ncbi:hypothetical protein GGI20_002732 [Coemansia sp. BCRC 34301]|nr:hypothetical protein GGI20_002732 [Coemansia sp. BCRC 34301]
MPSDGHSLLYTDSEPGYRNTKLDSGVPPPSLSTLPRIFKTPRSANSNAVPMNGQHSRSIQHLPPSHLPHRQHQQQQQHMERPPVPAASAIDVMGRLFVVIENTRGPNFVEQLSTPDWSRMMSERDDVRGRRTDVRLLNGQAELAKDLERQREALIRMGPSAAEFSAACAPSNPHEALEFCSALDNSSSVALGHLDFLLQPVKEYLGAESGIKFVDLGSKHGGFSRYILWRANRDGRGRGVKGWYLRGCDAKKLPIGAPDADYGLDIERLPLDCNGAADSLREYGSGMKASPDILDPAAVEAFIEFVKSSGAGTGGIDLVVAESGSSDSLALPDFGTDLEQRQYAFIISQAVIALRLLRKGGTFVFKMSDTSTPLSAEILFLLLACFERMAIVRSLASRPTSAERYIVCNHLRGEPRWVASHLLVALTRMHTDQLKLSHLVSWTRVSAERQFMGKLSSVNVTLAHAQLAALKSAQTNHRDY